MSYFDFDFDFDLLCGASVSSADSSATMSQDSSNFSATSSEEEPLTWESFNPPSAQPVSQTQTCDEQNNWTFYREQFNSTSAQPVSQTSAEPAAPVPAASTPATPPPSALENSMPIAHQAQEPRLTKRQRNNIAVKKCREKAKEEQRRLADKVKTNSALAKRMRSILDQINQAAIPRDVRNELDQCLNQLL